MSFFCRTAALLLLAISLCALAASPALAADSSREFVLKRASSASVDREDAAAALVAAVKLLLGSAATSWGRSVETQCDPPRRKVFECSWWVVAKTVRGRSLTDARIARIGGGRKHLDFRTVRAQGSAQVIDQGRSGLRFKIS